MKKLYLLVSIFILVQICVSAPIITGLETNDNNKVLHHAMRNTSISHLVNLPSPQLTALIGNWFELTTPPVKAYEHKNLYVINEYHKGFVMQISIDGKDKVVIVPLQEEPIKFITEGTIKNITLKYINLANDGFLTGVILPDTINKTFSLTNRKNHLLVITKDGKVHILDN